MLHVALFVAILLAVLIQTDQQLSRLESNPCINAKTCGECISTADVCAWCSSETFESSWSRCELYNHLLASGACKIEDIQFPQYKLKIIKDQHVRGGSNKEQAIQVQPQAISLKVRPNQPVDLKLKFRQAENYPVDLYFLLDMSHSMFANKEDLAQERLLSLGEAMAKTMKNITKDFLLGFGSFVDKFVMPYIPWTEEMLKSRCPPGVQCKRPHNFKNQQGLTSNVTLFSTRMRDALSVMSQSLDDPEGGMDAMIQVLACDGPIGWRERSRRIIVYSSNSWFHMAGDGKLGGAVVTNDGQCHLDVTGTHAIYDKILDYPSVSQLAAKIQEKRANVVFAVTDPVYEIHRQLSEYFEGATIDTLAAGSANIISLVEDNYKTLRSKVVFNPTNAENIEVTFKSKCKGNVLLTTNECSGLELGESVVFDVTILVSPELCKRKRHTFDIAAVGLAEKLTVDLEVLCDCDCEKEGLKEPSSPKCSGGMGTYECGQCTCNPNRYGRICECDESKLSSVESLEKCKANPNSTLVCSGHGDCVCGVCECFATAENTARRFSAKYCQCNDFSCDYFDRQLCGGPTRGVCKCGQCQCLPGYKGDNCGCSTKNDTCIASNGNLCFGQGTCVCGKCKCYPGTQYRGPTCEDCPTCPSKCSQYRPCARCKGFGTGEYGGNECAENCVGVQIVSEVKEQPGVRVCRFSDKSGCLLVYSYEYDENNIAVIKVQEKKECPEEAPVLAIALGITGGIVLIGLLLILLIVFIRRRQAAKEYADFTKEREKARWESEGNPIYKDPQSTFQNPTYRRQIQGKEN